MANREQGRQIRLSASELSHHHDEHPADLITKTLCSSPLRFRAKSQSVGNRKLCLHFAIRASGMAEKLKILSFGLPPVALCNVAGDGNRCAPQLIRQSKSLVRRKGCCELVDRQAQFNSPLPCD